MMQSEVKMHGAMTLKAVNTADFHGVTLKLKTCKA